MARLGFAIANMIDASVSPVNNLPAAVQKLAEKIAKSLMEAERPVVISGASCQSESVIKAAANIAWALQRKNANTGIVLTMPECNSMGLAMTGGHRLNSAFDAVLNGHADTVIIMENDLYRHGQVGTVNDFLKKAKTVIVFDHIIHATADQAHIVLSAGTFAESDGTIVNNEGRAQRYFQVFECSDQIQESWRWILQLAELTGNAKIRAWKNFEDVTRAIAKSEPLLRSIDQVSPPPTFRVAGQKIPREPHRYSGRTAMLANVNVSEPKPPTDPDSPMSYTFIRHSLLLVAWVEFSSKCQQISGDSRRSVEGRRSRYSSPFATSKRSCSILRASARSVHTDERSFMDSTDPSHFWIRGTECSR
jgi:NADH-quinone oxidoreductase subunit G